MAKPLILKLSGVEYPLAPTKLERRKLYGWTEMRATTPDGDVCNSVGLASNGQIIIPKGAIKLGILKEDGSWLDKSELVAVHFDGTPAEFVPSSFDSELILEKKVSIEDFLNYTITSVYQLEGEAASNFISAIGSEIYTFKFNYRGDYEASDAFLLCTEKSPYIFVGTKAQFDFIGLEEQSVIDEPDDEVQIDEDELDFSMM